MRKAKVDVFAFDELSEEARERAHRDWVSEGMPYCWDAEARDTIKAFEREFGVKIREWEYSSCGYDFHLDTGSIDDAVLALKGNRARAWFWNNHGSVLLEPRVRYFTHDREGRRIEAVAVDSVKYRSKIAFTRVYDGTCPWTGYCLDNDALDPIAYFCFGVEWDEKGKRRVQSKARTLRQDDANTVESLLRDSVDALFRSLKEDCAYQESMEAFKDACEANLYEFTEDGKIWCKKEVA